MLVSNLRVSNSKAIEESELVRITALVGTSVFRVRPLRNFAAGNRASSFEIFARDNSQDTGAE